MKCKGNKKSKKTKLSLKYNIQKRVREAKRRVRKEAKKLGVAKKVRKDPGIPNNWPFKAEMLANLQVQKEKKEKEMEKKREQTKRRAKNEQKKQTAESQKMLAEREADRRQKRAEVAKKSQGDAFRRTLNKADTLLEVLDARDPVRCRCAAFETWAQEKGKRIIFVLAKADLVAPAVVAQWIHLLGQVAPTVAVQAEAGREGLRELLSVLGHTGAGASSSAVAPGTLAKTVGVVGYPGTGKKSLLKNLRREGGTGQSRWLLESVGRFHPSAGSLDASSSLHLAMRGIVLQTPAGASPSWSGAAHLDIVRHLVERVNQQLLLRRLRLPGYDSVETLLKTYAKERSINGKKGKEPELAMVAERFLTELTASPGCVCAVSPEATAACAASGPLWQAHGADKPRIEAAMEAQHAALTSRAAGPSANALSVNSAASFGPAMDVAAAAEMVAEDPEMDDEDDDEDDDDEESMGDAGYEEGEEEEEGEESEEEDGEGDKDMK